MYHALGMINESEYGLARDRWKAVHRTMDTVYEDTYIQGVDKAYIKGLVAPTGIGGKGIL